MRGSRTAWRQPTPTASTPTFWRSSTADPLFPGRTFAVRLGHVSSTSLAARLQGHRSGWFLSDNRQPLRDDDLELGVAVEEGGAGTAWRSEHFDLWEALEDFLPQHLDLQFGHSCTDAAVNAGAEGQVTARVGSVDDEVVRPLEHVFVTVS